MLLKSIIVAIGSIAAVNAQGIVPGTTGQLGNASVITDNPIGRTYQAVLPNSNKTGIRGSVVGTTGAGGKGVQFSVSLTGFPSASLGPFIYHIHESPVPTSGNCTGTGAHLDPYIRGETPPCDPTTPSECQVGDLAGKHGNVTTSSFQATYLDTYISSTPGNKAFFGSRSIVIHTNNKTRLTCANFTLVATGANATSTGPAVPTKTIVFSGAAAKAISGSAVLAGLMVMFL